MEQAINYFKKNKTKTAAIIFAILVVILYFPVTLSDYSYNPSFNAATGPVTDQKDFGCNENCGRLSNTIDPGADGDQIWPLIKLTTMIYTDGELPLWNPYIAGGLPLAADSTNFVFSPLIIFYFLPNALWDVPLLISVWIAGFFTFLFLRCWKLSFSSCLVGGIIFMFAGHITWYLPHDSILVFVFTPLILYCIEKIFQSKNSIYVIIGGVSFAVAILGGHLETIALQILIISFYGAFRLIHSKLFLNYEKIIVLNTNPTELVYDYQS